MDPGLRVPRLMIGATQSGVGKTTISLGLMAALRKRGLGVQGFKAGPDYIDPSHHTFVTGRPSRNLDTWMMSNDVVCELFARAARDTDIAVIEGVMGLYDGVTGVDERGSSAHLAKALRCPVVLVINAASMARSAAALVLGFLKLDPAVSIAGVIANNIASDTHYETVKSAIERHTGVPVFGYLKRDSSMAIQERHLGLVPKPEGEQRVEFYERIGAEIEKTVNVDGLLAVAAGAGPLPPFEPQVFTGQSRAKRARIAVAFDEAFNFYYQDNLDLLKQEGGEIVKFSPVRDRELPPDAGLVYIGGGFPEMYAAELSGNTAMLESLRARAQGGKPIYAECGGLMYLSKSIQGFDERRHDMAGLLPVRVRMTRKRVALGYVTVEAVQDTFLCERWEQFRGHEFHYSCLDESDKAEFAFQLRKESRADIKQDGIVVGQTLACYAHAHFGSYPTLAKRLVAAACGD